MLQCIYKVFTILNVFFAKDNHHQCPNKRKIIKHAKPSLEWVQVQDLGIEWICYQNIPFMYCLEHLNNLTCLWKT